MRAGVLLHLKQQFSYNLRVVFLPICQVITDEAQDVVSDVCNRGCEGWHVFKSWQGDFLAYLVSHQVSPFFKLTKYFKSITIRCVCL